MASEINLLYTHVYIRVYLQMQATHTCTHTEHTHIQHYLGQLTVMSGMEENPPKEEVSKDASG